MMDAELAPPNKEMDYPTERFLALFVAKVRNIPEAVEIYDGLGEHARFTRKSIEKFNLEREIGVLTAVASFCADENGDLVPNVRVVLQAALLGSAQMQYNYGVWLVKGMRIPKNERLGFIFTLAAAQQEYIKAMTWLGILYRLGRGVEENEWRALEWFEAAIAKGDADAYGSAGEGYANLVTRGHTEYADRAIELLEKAIEHGEEDCRKALDMVQKYLYEHNL